MLETAFGLPFFVFLFFQTLRFQRQLAHIAAVYGITTTLAPSGLIRQLELAVGIPAAEYLKVCNL